MRGKINLAEQLARIPEPFRRGILVQARRERETVFGGFERRGELTQSDLTVVLSAEQKCFSFFQYGVAFALFAAACGPRIEIGNFGVRQKSGLGLQLTPFTVIQTGQNEMRPFL